MTFLRRLDDITPRIEVETRCRRQGDPVDLPLRKLHHILVLAHEVCDDSVVLPLHCTSKLGEHALNTLRGGQTSNLDRAPQTGVAPSALHDRSHPTHESDTKTRYELDCQRRRTAKGVSPNRAIEENYSGAASRD